MCIRDRVKFVPERFDKTYFHWMENIKDWCISRQLWWGHRIPAYYCADCGEMIVAKEAPHTCPKCGSKNLKQDEDTLDTWFSSALWPFSTLGWLENADDYKYFYPTSTLVTGYDIIFFWVARMIFSGIEHTGKVLSLIHICIGRKAEEVIELLQNIKCGFRGTSCPAQLALALKQALSEE